MSELKSTWQRILLSIDTEYKNKHKFDGGDTIHLRRNVDNFDRRETEPVNAICIHGGSIPAGAELLCHHHCAHDQYRLFDFPETSGEAITSPIRYYSVPESLIYAWRINSEPWQPTKGFAFALRIFKPYMGVLSGIYPTVMKQKLFLTTGELKHKVCMVLRASDYQIVFQNEKGQEENLVRLRHYENEVGEREEVVAIDHDTTDKIYSGEYWLGLLQSDAKPFKNVTESVI
jgi:hypothetical protein